MKRRIIAAIAAGIIFPGITAASTMSSGSPAIFKGRRGQLQSCSINWTRFNAKLYCTNRKWNPKTSLGRPSALCV